MTVGCPGGDDQAQADLQLILNVLVFGMNPQQAVEAPRFATQTLVNSFWPRVYKPGQLNVEAGIPERTRTELRALGHEVTEIGACGIGAVVTRRDPETGVLSAGADPRRPTYALSSSDARQSVTPFLTNLGGGKNLLFVKVETDGGPHGWGECYTQSDRDTQHPRARRMRSAATWSGATPSDITHFVHMAYHDFSAKRGAMDFWSAVSGIEQALWDIAGKRHGVPVYELLGGRCRDRIRVYANGWYRHGTPAEYAADAKATVARGFTALKFDPFPGPWRTHITREAEEQAIATVAAVREAVGPDVDLLIEVHRRLAPMHAIRIARAMERFRPFWFEEPVSSTNLDALAECRRQISHPDRDRRGAVHARGVPARLRAARGRHHQPRRVQLRRHPGAARDRADGGAVVRDGLAAQLQQHHGRARGDDPRLGRDPELPHHRVLRELRGARPRDRAPGLRGAGWLHRGAAQPRARRRAGRSGPGALSGPGARRTVVARAGERGSVEEASMAISAQARSHSGRAAAIPVIDFGPCFAGTPGALEATAAELRETLEQVGFFVMVNHGVPPALIARTFDEARRFHDQPMDRKLALRMNEHNNGYMTMGRYAVWTSDVNANDKPDLNEAFFTKRERGADDPLLQSGRRFVGPNQWPDDLPGFRESVLAYTDAMDALSARVLPGGRGGARAARRPRSTRRSPRASSRSASRTIRPWRPRRTSSGSRRTPTRTS